MRAIATLATPDNQIFSEENGCLASAISVAHSNKTNLVNEFVVAIAAHHHLQETLMKRIIVDAFILEVARALDRDLSERFGDEFSSTLEQQLLMAVLLALTDWGFLTHNDHRREALFWFGAEAKLLGDAVPDERLIELATHKIRIMLTKSEIDLLKSQSC